MKIATTWRRGPVATSIPLFLAALLAACGGDSSGPTPPGQTPAFTLTLSASTASVTAGASTSLTVNIVRTGGFEGAVAVAIEGLPQGVTAPAANIPAGSTSGTVQLNAAAGATVGTSNVTVRGTGTGVDPRTATFSLTVNSAETPDFALSVGAPNASVAAGESTQIQVSVSRTGGFNGPVALTATGVPAGVTATFNPETIPTGSATSTLTLAASAGAAVATSTVTVRATATGVTGERTAPVALQVTAAPTQGGDVVWSFCGLTGIPVWAAIQDGEGAWTQLAGASGQYEFSVSSARGGVAYVIVREDGRAELHVFYGSKSELAQHGQGLCEGAEGPGKTINGTVTGFSGGIADAVIVSLGGVLPSSAPTSMTPNITFNGVPDRTLDLMASLSTLNMSTFEFTPSRIVARRGISPAAGSTLPTIDFNGPESFAPAQHSLTLNGAGGGEEVFAMTAVQTANGFMPTLGMSTSPASWYSLPANRIESGDLHLLMATAATMEALAPSRTTVRMITQPGNLTVGLGPILGSPAITPLTGVGQRRVRAVYNAQAEYDRFWFASFDQGLAGGNRSASVQMTRGYRGSGTGSVTLEVPEFDGVAGWQATWGLRPSQLLTWTMSAVGWTGDGGIDRPVFADGNEYRSASRMGELP